MSLMWGDQGRVLEIQTPRCLVLEASGMTVEFSDRSTAVGVLRPIPMRTDLSGFSELACAVKGSLELNAGAVACIEAGVVQQRVICKHCTG